MTPLNSVLDLNTKNYPTDSIIESNLLVLYQRLKMVEALAVVAGLDRFHVDSGLRSAAQQDALVKAGKTKARKSKHLVGMAADIYDPENKLKEWLLENPAVLVDANLWCEHYDYTKGWCHFQTSPPVSGNRWFIP
jgi:hypothetical protein